MTYFIISFLLSGKFASWRDPSTIVTAKSYLYPSNTNIIGILGAAFGISKEEELITKIQNKLYGVGVQGIFNEIFFTGKRLFLERLYNYSHLEPNRIKTIQTWEYIVNPNYRIIVVTQQKEFAEKLKHYLENPEYPIYLGRSEFIGKVEEVVLKEYKQLEKLKTIKNTHIDECNIKLKENNTVLCIVKKLRRYHSEKKLYNHNLFSEFCEIIGEVTLETEREGIDNIPIIHLD